MPMPPGPRQPYPPGQSNRNIYNNNNNNNYPTAPYPTERAPFIPNQTNKAQPATGPVQTQMLNNPNSGIFKTFFALNFESLIKFKSS
jgi:hypothetical protein